MAKTPQNPDNVELDLFTVLTALGSGLHADLSPISEGGQFALANALILAAAEEGWAIAGTDTAAVLAAVTKARTKLAAPLALVPTEIADEEVLVELGVDPEGPTDLADLLKAGTAVQVLPGLALLAYTGKGTRRRDGVTSVSVKLPGKS
ncbi:MAG: hypothetical protein ACT4QG_00845 [Sporichthyaceae bacterium]